MPWAWIELTSAMGAPTSRLQQPAVGEPDAVRRGILQATRGVLRLAMVHHAGLLVHELVQGAAQRDIEFLMAAAHREQGQVPGQRRPNQRQGTGIALWVVRHGQRLGRRVVPRLDIRDAARQEQAVDQVE